ncbi:MAG: beta family protein [Acidobacteriia bacterium]|nr:beta family protein [Terriglobia bacterium]
MFGANHYVPILRWKPAERGALKELRDEDRGRITPLIEIPRKLFEAPQNKDTEGQTPVVDQIPFEETEGQRPDPGQVLFKVAKGLLDAWRYDPFFVDLCHVDGQIPQIRGTKHTLIHIAQEARRLKLKLIPVTGLSRKRKYQIAVSHVAAADGRGACVRVFPDDVLRPTFAHDLTSLLRNLSLKVADVDLLLDCQDFDSEKPSYETLLNRIPRLEEWRTFTLASGAFPQDLQRFERGIHKIERHDWLTWQRLALGEVGLRKPSFSDYTVQYGRYVEPPDFCNPSASIRYTLAEHWLIMRGEGILNEGGPGCAQYPASATLWCESNDFYGPDFSYGDRYISRMSDGADTDGNPATWIRAGINHHMTVVSRQIASLPSSLGIDAPRRANSRYLHSQPIRHRSKRGA